MHIPGADLIDPTLNTTNSSIPATWHTTEKWELLSRRPEFQSQHTITPSGALEYAFRIVPLENLTELSECASCQQDAGALREFVDESGLLSVLPNDTDSTLEANVCATSFIVCVRDEATDEEGYVLALLTALEYFRIDSNNLSGTLRPLASMKRLQTLMFGYNQLEGPLPAELGGFTELQEMRGAVNRLTALPPSIDGWKKVSFIDLRSNAIQDRLPPFGQASALRELYLADNQIEGFTDNGTMPEGLVTLNMEFNRLTSVPEGWNSMPALEEIFLKGNQLTGWPTWGRTPARFCQANARITPHITLYLLALPAPPYWPVIQRADFSGNPLGVEVRDFMQTFRELNTLMTLSCAGCGLTGRLDCDSVTFYDHSSLSRYGNTEFTERSVAAYPTLRPGFVSLTRLFLSHNSIVALDELRLRNLARADLSSNALESVRGDWLAGLDVRIDGNPNLRIDRIDDSLDIQSCEDVLSLKNVSADTLVPNPAAYVPQRDPKGLSNSTYECTTLCNTWIMVDFSVAEEKLCRCLPGYSGTGKACTMCPAGTHSNRQVGTQSCQRCPDDAGSEEGSAACFCRLGYEKRGNEPCEPCTAGSVGVRNAGSDGSRSRWICQDCQEGLDCSVPINYNASVLPRFFQLTARLQSAGASPSATREVTTYSAGLTELPIVIPCPLPASCRGTDKASGLNICSEGHEGFVCNRCKRGFSRQTPQQPCAPCAALWQIVVVNVLLVVATLLAIFILTALAERAAATQRAEVPSQLTKIGLSHITAVCGLAFLVFDESLWGDQISSLVRSFFGWSGGVPQSYQVWECLLRPYVGDKCVLYRHSVWLGLPLIWLTAVPLVASGFDKVREALKSKRRIGTDDSFATDTYLRALSAPPSVTNEKAHKAAAEGPYQRAVTFQESATEPETPASCQHSLAEPRKSGRWRQWLDDRGTMMVVILTFIHPTVTKSMLALLRCRWYPYVPDVIPIATGEGVSRLPLDPRDQPRPRMDLDPHVICRSAEHAPFLWIAVAGLLLWTFAPVICGVAFLCRHRDSLQDHHTRRRVGFLYTGYRKHFFYWDAVLAMRRVLVLLIAQQATSENRQLLGWTVIAAACLALQFAVWPFDRGSMDILNLTELRGLLVWLMSLFIMQFVVILPEGTSLAIALVLVVIAVNLVHYVMVAIQICRFGLLQVGYRYTALTDRKQAIARLMTGCLTGPIVSWLIHREEQRREVAPKVFYDWSSAALSVDGPPAAASAASGKCHPSFGRPVHRVVTAMQLTSAAMQDVIETLKLTHVPSDL
ncbi:unnamed protein product [Vitrella brassicaformis CCMP3155]|uniref:EGF-like domain-containing protein n=1 Tax=Vitrella brassicaformis (strain CCMP3155) TaxID=1169540 RepID=A0A0G4EET5_VITBC|nr:unnamed protein product [Vitrella brassicaformis CCMP3155]|eukprot:CEL94516.1 unnamed protein product [Vitrella brassicaformis CCMP3155]